MNTLQAAVLEPTEIVVDGFSGVMQMLDSRGAGGSGGGFEDTSQPPGTGNPAFEDPPF